jgi:nitrogen PTS system EIIA component
VQLTVRDLAKLLNVAEKTIYRWVKQGTLPVYRIQDQYRFDRTEILEWASARRVPVSPDALTEPAGSHGERVSLVEALRSGGIFYRLGGSSKREALRSFLEVLPLPSATERGPLLDALVAREELASTGVGDGVAIPHARHPIVLDVERSVLALGFLEEPLDFHALDGRPVHALFLLICPTVRAHLHLLSRLSFALRDPGFAAVVQRQALREEILAEASRVEAGLRGAAGP